MCIDREPRTQVRLSVSEVAMVSNTSGFLGTSGSIRSVRGPWRGRRGTTVDLVHTQESQYRNIDFHLGSPGGVVEPVALRAYAATDQNWFNYGAFYACSGAKWHYNVPTDQRLSAEVIITKPIKPYSLTTGKL